MKEFCETKLGNLETELEDVKNLGKQFREVSKIPSIESRLSGVDERIRDIDNIRKDYDDESVRIASIERELSKIRNMKQIIEDETARIIESKFAEMDKKIPAVEDLRNGYSDEINRIASIEKEMPDLQSLKQELEEEKASRISMEKKLEDTKAPSYKPPEKEMPAASDDIAKLRADIASQKQTINEMEKRLEKQAIKFFAENLEEFAHALEKRFPRLIKEEQYYKDMHAIEQKLKSIETPDLSPLASRVELLEQHISEIQRMMKSVSSRMPMVVE